MPILKGIAKEELDDAVNKSIDLSMGEEIISRLLKAYEHPELTIFPFFQVSYNNSEIYGENGTSRRASASHLVIQFFLSLPVLEHILKNSC